MNSSGTLLHRAVRRRSRNSLVSTTINNNNNNMDSITPVQSSNSNINNNVKSTMTKSSSSSRVSRSPSRTSIANNTPRALRLLRLLLYSVAAPNFIYSMYVQLVVLKGPGRTPLPASILFGRDTLFLTFHGNFHCTWYALLCLLNSFLSAGPLFKKRKQLTNNNSNNNNNNNSNKIKKRSYAARTVELLSHRTTAMLFPLIMFVGLGYYLILHFHPLNRLRAKLVPDHDSKMALLHFNPLLFMLFDSWLKDSDLLSKYGLKKRKATKAIIIYGIIYFTWTAFCVKMNGGHWPYPFQKSFSVVQHLMFLLFAVLCSAYFCHTGFRLHGRLDRRRRRRLNANLERSSSSTTSNSIRNADINKSNSSNNIINDDVVISNN